MGNQNELFDVPKPTVSASFERDALGFLIAFAKRRKAVPFSAEEVTLAARAKNICPADLRAWGPIFMAAAKDGHIRRCTDRLFQRAMGNGTLAAGWVGC